MHDDNTNPESDELYGASAQTISRSERVPASLSGSRLDSIAAELFPEYSRSKLQSWIKEGALLVDSKIQKPNSKLVGGELLKLEVTLEQPGQYQAQDIDITVVYEDASLIVVNKAAGMVVHPAAGNPDGTLLNALLYRYPELQHLPRAGIVHRLDKDTSGLMVVARSLPAQNLLVAQLQARTVSRVYEAVVHGVPDDGIVEADIGRHPNNRLKMAVVKNGKPARTHYSVINYNQHFSHLRVKLDTGRTHQIRVHMAHIGYPLVGDPVYGKSINRNTLKHSENYIAAQNFPRQALNAVRLGLKHPEENRDCQWRVPLSDDLQSLVETLFSDDNKYP